MAKGKIKRPSYFSKGEVPTLTRKTLNGIRKDRLDSTVFMNKFEAYLNGKNPWLVIDNPNKEETNKRKIRVKAIDIYGSIKNRARYMIKGAD